MTFEVRLFAGAKDLAGAESVRVELPEGATVGDLRRRLAADHPALAGLLGRCAVAVNDEFADDGVPLPEAAEVAVLPPVSGGSAEPNLWPVPAPAPISFVSPFHSFHGASLSAPLPVRAARRPACGPAAARTGPGRSAP